MRGRGGRWQVRRWAVLGVTLALLGGAGAGRAGPDAAPTAPPGACATLPAALAARLAVSPPNEVPFVRIQARVLDAGCAHLADFEDPAWFTGTLPLFLGRLLGGGGGWPAVHAACAQPLTGPLTCGEGMVREHIHGDLLAALRVVGCGTARDWARVGADIHAAAAAEGPVWAWGAAVLIPVRRLEVRLRCLRGEWDGP